MYNLRKAGRTQKNSFGEITSPLNWKVFRNNIIYGETTYRYFFIRYNFANVQEERNGLSPKYSGN